MRRTSRTPSRDLAIACCLALVGAGVAIAEPGGWLQAILAAPLALAVPGYALSAALFPPATIERGDRVVYSFVLSIGAAALGGLAAQLLLDLGSDTWAGLLAVTTLAASAVAQRRRAVRGLPTSPPRPPRRRLGFAGAIALLAAVAICGAAIAVATQGVHEQQSNQRFASLWALPAQSESGAPRLEVGVWNHGGPAEYRLEVRREGRSVARLRLRLGPNRRWRARLDPGAPAGDSVLVVGLYHRSEQPYRSVELDLRSDR